MPTDRGSFGGRRAYRGTGLALIELLVAVVIIALLAGAMYGLWRGKGAGKKSMPEQMKDRARDAECQLNLQSTVRPGIQMAAMDNDGKPPAQLPSDVAGYAKCAVSGQAYSYDPRTGKAWCTTPGHEDF